ncbi:hypothetical protein JKP88DRAFT_284976 [Tribonema minus]|uniref:CBM1 domain-containing protein n=1 Tax=Tribonema minus TaxID=303371 RepID=A0A835ZN21_9STRA|nr:hypothetical protein JKP88DRAFT_284976 [Tribonema minus]
MGWLGSQCCVHGTECIEHDTYYSLCVKKGSPAPPPMVDTDEGPFAGRLWNGAKCCKAGSQCLYKDEWTSKCVLKSTIDSTVTWWKQCGGAGYVGPTQCLPGSTCTVKSPQLSRCEPDDSSSGGGGGGGNGGSAGDGLPTGCPALHERCGGSTYRGEECCAPGTKCHVIDGWFSMCVRPGEPVEGH